MKITVGETIKYIRMSKNIMSKNVYCGILSRPAISKFEKGISDTTTDKLFKILENLNISLEEFFYIYNSDKIKEENIHMKKYFNFFYKDDLKGLAILRDENKIKYEKSQKIKYLHFSALMDLTITYIGGDKVNNQSIQVLKGYLLHCEEWNYYELMLFTNSLDFFSEEIILLLYKRAKNKLAYFKELHKHSNEIFTLILNILIYFIEKNNISNSNFFYKELLTNVSSANNRMYENTMIIFLKDLLNIMNTKSNSNSNIDNIISIFIYLEMPLKAKQCSKLVEIVINNNVNTEK